MNYLPPRQRRLLHYVRRQGGKVSLSALSSYLRGTPGERKEAIESLKAAGAIKMVPTWPPPARGPVGTTALLTDEGKQFLDQLDAEART